MARVAECLRLNTQRGMQRKALEDTTTRMHERYERVIEFERFSEIVYIDIKANE